MKRVGGLFEQTVDFHALCRAARRAARGKTMSPGTAHFLFHMETEVLRLQRELLSGTYRPHAYQTFRIRDPKPRTISAATFRDRVVHHALCAMLEPIFERRSIHHSYACRRGKGTHAALRQAQRWSRRFAYALHLDVLHFFETADHEVLRRLLARCVKDPRLLALADVFIEAGAPGSPAGKGLPIGNLTSQHFANFYLTALDHHLLGHRRLLGVGAYLRYLDDLVLFADQRSALWRAHDAVSAFLHERLRLALRPDATWLVPTREGISFLGFRVWPEVVRLDPRRVRRFRRSIRTLHRLRAAGAIDDQALQRRTASVVGHASWADTVRLRRTLLRRLAHDGPDPT